MKRLFFSLLILMIAIAGFAPLGAVQAQEDEYLERVDQVMVHLSGFLGKTITRSSNYWTWAERYYNDASLDCPTPGESYAQVQTRAYRITVTDDEIVYDYRITSDGSVLVLCGESGAAVFRSDHDGATTPSTGTGPSSFTLQSASWHAWVYMDGNDLLYLINPNGEQVVMKRPALSNETGANEAELVISPNGKYLLQAVKSLTGNALLSIYNFELGDFVGSIEAQAQERILLGYGYDYRAGSSYIFDPLSQRAAVAFVNELTGAWRLSIIDLNTGGIVRNLNNSDLTALLPVSAPSELSEAASNSNAFFPNVVYFDSLGGVHSQLVLANAGGAPRYPAFVWYPDTNIAGVSPYIHTGADVLPPTGNAVFTYQDSSFAFLPENGPFESHNTLAQGTAGGTSFTPQNLYQNSSFYLFGPRWIDNGQRIAISLQNDTSGQWAIYNPLSSATIQILPPVYEEAHGVAGGLLSFDAERNLTFIAELNSYTSIWQTPPRVGEPHIIWTQAPNTGLGVTTLNLVKFGQGSSSSIPSGTQLCAGTMPSRLTVGGMARVTFSDGTPLRLRQTPAGTFMQDMVEGTQFVVIGGPQCVNNMTWWNLQLANGTTGWSAEADTDSYFMEPIS